MRLPNLTPARLGCLVAVREQHYKRIILETNGITLTGVKQLLMIWEIVHRKRLLGVSIKQLQDDGYYSHSDYSTKHLHELFSQFHVRGLLSRVRTREAGVLWSLTALGKGYVREYCAWIGGEHDGEIGLDVSFMEKW